MFSQDRQEVLVVVEIGQIHAYLDLIVLRKFISQSIPEIRPLQLPSTIRKGRIKYQTQGVQKIAFSDSVLTQDHRIFVKNHVNMLEIPEIAYSDSLDPHVESPPFFSDRLHWTRVS